jgi:preprotein translocase subunit SecA
LQKEEKGTMAYMALEASEELNAQPVTEYWEKSIQNFVSLYPEMSGMTATANSSEENLEVRINMMDMLSSK